MKKILTAALMAAAAVGANAEEQAKAYMVADAHLDTQWNWDVQTTIEEYVWNTINQNLFLLEQYPDYIFNFEGGVKYAWMKEYYPREYELMKKYIKNGRWHICGASWDATDAVVPSVESAIRNVMLGQDYYRNEFGVESTDIFLPDCFGFPHTLPTVAAHCGLIGFSSQKLDWREKPFYGDSKHPFTIGLWQGVDGSRIMLAHGYDYGRRWDNVDLSEEPGIVSLATKNPLKTLYRYYGTGDIGGSPTQGSVASVEKGLKGKGPVKIISATSDQLFKDYMPYESHPELEVFDGELLMDVHGTGCYTSQTAMKLYNRQNELLGDAAERALVGAELYNGAAYPNEALTESWRRFIWHQFHDDLTGTSIPRAYEFSWNDELLSLKQFSDLLTNGVANVAATLNTEVKGTPVVLYNPLGYEVSDQVEISIPAKVRPASASAVNAQGKSVPAQVVDFRDGMATVAVNATVPPVGFAVYGVSVSGKGKEQPATKATTVENSVYRLTFDSNGDLSSIFDKRNNKELVQPGKAVRLALFTENKSYPWPAWEVIKSTVDADPISITDDVDVSLVENGNIRKTVKVTKRYGDSKFTQYIHLYEGALADRIDFENDFDWATTNALLKAEFPLAVSNPKATYDLGLGVAERGNNTDIAYEVPAQQWANLTDASGNYGVTITNDSKYGWDKPNDNTLRLTLLHTPKTDRGYAYQDRNDMGRNRFTYSLIGHNGALDRAAAGKAADVLNQGVKAFVSPRHKGNGRTLSLASTDADNVVIKAFKKAEDGKGYVVRVYETAGKPAKANINFSLPVKSASKADGTEKATGKAPFSGNSLAVELVPNGVATFRVDFDGVAPKAPAMAQIALPFNKKAFTYNEFRNNGDFADGYTYAAELIPTNLNYNGIEFTFDPKQEMTAVASKGDTIMLPAGKWDKVHILAAAASSEDLEGTFKVGKNSYTVTVPSYTGFIGQWGHKGHTTGYLKEQPVAFTGTHRHSSGKDEPYEYTYMFNYSFDVPKDAEFIVLPDNPGVAVFAATVSAGDVAAVQPAMNLFESAILPAGEGTAEELTAVLTPEMIKSWSGFVDDSEKPAFLVDGDKTTKWCDINGLPSYVDFDMGAPTEIKGWKLVNAAQESASYVTAGCYLQGRNSANEEWKTLDYINGNKMNAVSRTLDKPVNVRQLRLLVTHPNQTADNVATRIYEFQVYK